MFSNLRCILLYKLPNVFSIKNLYFLECNLIFHTINVAELSIVINGESNLFSKWIHSLKNKIMKGNTEYNLSIFNSIP